MPRKRILDDDGAVATPKVAAAPSLYAALQELSDWRFRFRDLPELTAVMQELDRLDHVVKLLDALRYARQLETEGYPRPEAAARAASVFHQPREQVLQLLRTS